MSAWDVAAVVVPVLLLTVGAALLAYGLVAWCAVEDRRRRDTERGRRIGRWS